MTKTTYAEQPLRVEYHLTAFGETLLPVIAVLGQWSEAHREQLQRVLAAPVPAGRVTKPA